MLLRLAYLGITNAFALLRLLPGSDRDKDTEILALRHQLMVLQRQLGGQRVWFEPADRAWLSALLGTLPRASLHRLMLLVRPDTVLRWHRDLHARRHAARSRPRRRGRLRTVRSIRTLVLRLVAENPSWGYRRVHGELLTLWVKVAASTVWEILRAGGDRSGSGPCDHDLGTVPAFAGRGDPRRRRRFSSRLDSRCAARPASRVPYAVISAWRPAAPRSASTIIPTLVGRGHVRCRRSGPGRWVQNGVVKIVVGVPAVLSVVVVLAAGCGAPSSPSAGSSVAAVPSGCVPSASAVRWSGIEEAPTLEHVSLFSGRTSADGKEVLALPVIASVTGVEAPASWVPILAAGLGERLGRKVNTSRPSSSYETSFVNAGDVDPTIPEKVAYQGVHRVSATFSVDCGAAVGGVFTAWTEIKSGGLLCGGVGEPTDPYAQAARRYCPRTPGPSLPDSGAPSR
jgi:hypothetical protein